MTEVVKQHVREVLRYVDRVYVMNRGRTVLSGDAVDVLGRIDEIEAAYPNGRPNAPDTSVA